MNLISEELCDCAGLAADTKNIWYITNLESLLMCLDLENKKVVCYGKIPNSKCEDYAYRTLLYNDFKLYMLPFNTDTLCIYDITKDKFELISFSDEIKKVLGKKCQIFGGFFYEQELVMYGVRPIIIRYNFIDRKFRCYVVNEEMLGFLPQCWFWRDGFGYEKMLYLPIAGYKAIVRIDIDNDEVDIINKGKNENYDFTIVKRYKDEIYLVLEKQEKICIEYMKLHSPRENYKIHTFIASDLYKSEETPLLWGDIIENTLILIPGWEKSGYIVNLDSGEVEIIDYIQKDNDLTNTKRLNCYGGVTIGRNVFSIVTWKKQLLKLDTGSMKIESFDIELEKESEKVIQKVFCENLTKRKIMREQGKIFELENFILNIERKKEEKLEIKNIGSEILNTILKDNRI